VTCSEYCYATHNLLYLCLSKKCLVTLLTRILALFLHLVQKCVLSLVPHKRGILIDVFHGLNANIYTGTNKEIR
jgi:hypothetical protein